MMDFVNRGAGGARAGAEAGRRRGGVCGGDALWPWSQRARHACCGPEEEGQVQVNELPYSPVNQEPVPDGTGVTFEEVEQHFKTSSDEAWFLASAAMFR